MEDEFQPKATKPVQHRGGLRVLVVDDEPIILDGMVGLLNLSGYRAEGFTNGLQALKLFAEDPEAFDVLITDQVMPQIGGDELVREIKSIRKKIPVIMCSGYSEPQVQDDPRERHANAFCEKPVQFSKLTELIEVLCSAN